MELKIEKDVPFSHELPRGKHAQTYKQMEDGDSILFEKHSGATSFCNALRARACADGHHIFTRKVEGGWRVWKVKRTNGAS
jgi:hypothetical protein